MHSFNTSKSFLLTALTFYVLKTSLTFSTIQISNVSKWLRYQLNTIFLRNCFTIRENPEKIENRIINFRILTVSGRKMVWSFFYNATIKVSKHLGCGLLCALYEWSHKVFFFIYYRILKWFIKLNTKSISNLAMKVLKQT